MFVRVCGFADVEWDVLESVCVCLQDMKVCLRAAVSLGLQCLFLCGQRCTVQIVCMPTGACERLRVHAYGCVLVCVCLCAYLHVHVCLCM